MEALPRAVGTSGPADDRKLPPATHVAVADGPVRRRPVSIRRTCSEPATSHRRRCWSGPSSLAPAQATVGTVGDRRIGRGQQIIAVHAHQPDTSGAPTPAAAQDVGEPVLRLRPIAAYTCMLPRRGTHGPAWLRLGRTDTRGGSAAVRRPRLCFVPRPLEYPKPASGYVQRYPRGVCFSGGVDEGSDAHYGRADPPPRSRPS